MFQDHLASKSMDVEDSMHTFSGDISFVYIHLIILQNGGNANTRFTIPRLLAFGRKPQDSFFLWSQLPANRCVCASIFSVEQTDKGCFLILLSQTFSPDTGHVQQEISALWVVCLQRLLLRESNKNTCFFLILAVSKNVTSHHHLTDLFWRSWKFPSKGTLHLARTFFQKHDYTCLISG